jgi:hypothetical protein
MNRFEESSVNSGGSEPSRDALEARIRELENENAQLRAKMQRMESEWEIDRDALEWHRSAGLPESAEEAANPKNAFTLREVLAECEREFGK